MPQTRHRLARSTPAECRLSGAATEAMQPVISLRPNDPDMGFGVPVRRGDDRSAAAIQWSAPGRAQSRSGADLDCGQPRATPLPRAGSALGSERGGDESPVLSGISRRSRDDRASSRPAGAGCRRSAQIAPVQQTGVAILAEREKQRRGAPIPRADREAKDWSRRDRHPRRRAAASSSARRSRAHRSSDAGRGRDGDCFAIAPSAGAFGVAGRETSSDCPSELIPPGAQIPPFRARVAQAAITSGRSTRSPTTQPW